MFEAIVFFCMTLDPNAARYDCGTYHLAPHTSSVVGCTNQIERFTADIRGIGYVVSGACVRGASDGRSAHHVGQQGGRDA